MSEEARAGILEGPAGGAGFELHHVVGADHLHGRGLVDGEGGSRPAPQSR